MKGSPKFEDKFGFHNLASNWSKNFFPTLGQPPVCLNAPICMLGVKFSHGSIPAVRHWRLQLQGVAVTHLLLSLFII